MSRPHYRNFQTKEETPEEVASRRAAVSKRITDDAQAAWEVAQKKAADTLTLGAVTDVSLKLGPTSVS